MISSISQLFDKYIRDHLIADMDWEDKPIYVSDAAEIEKNFHADVRELFALQSPYRASGKTLRQFEQFQAAIREGKTAEWHGKDYVVLSRNQYEKLKKKEGIVIIGDRNV